jgi:hypothetical protein
MIGTGFQICYSVYDTKKNRYVRDLQDNGKETKSPEIDAFRYFALRFRGVVADEWSVLGIFLFLHRI